MESMIELDIHKNQILLSIKGRGHKLFICPFRKDIMTKIILAQK